MSCLFSLNLVSLRLPGNQKVEARNNVFRLLLYNLTTLLISQSEPTTWKGGGYMNTGYQVSTTVTIPFLNQPISHIYPITIQQAIMIPTLYLPCRNLELLHIQQAVSHTHLSEYHLHYDHRANSNVAGTI